MKDDIRLLYKFLVQSLGSYCLVVSAASLGTIPQLKSVGGAWQGQILTVVLGGVLAALILARRPVWLVRPRNDTSGAGALALICVTAIAAISLGSNLAFAVAHGSGASGAFAMVSAIPPLMLGLALAVLTPLHTVSNYLSSRSFYSGRVIRHDTYVRRLAQWSVVADMLHNDAEEDTQALA